LAKGVASVVRRTNLFQTIVSRRAARHRLRTLPTAKPEGFLSRPWYHAVMTVACKRQLTRAAAWSAAVVSLLLAAGLAVDIVRERAEIQESRAVRLGMTTAEVETIFGRSLQGYVIRSQLWLLYGAKGRAKFKFRITCQRWLGRQILPMNHTDWSVRMRFDKNG